MLLFMRLLLNSNDSFILFVLFSLHSTLFPQKTENKRNRTIATITTSIIIIIITRIKEGMNQIPRREGVGYLIGF